MKYNLLFVLSFLIIGLGTSVFAQEEPIADFAEKET
jgi:hypothetical protein